MNLAFEENIIDTALVLVASQVIEHVKKNEDEPKKKRTRRSREWVLRRNPQEHIFREFEEEDRRKFIQCFRFLKKKKMQMPDMVIIDICFIECPPKYLTNCLE